MKVAIVSMGRAHLLQLAKQLDAKSDVDVTFYTMMPKSRCRKFGYNGKVKSLLLPVGLLELIIRKVNFVDAYKKDRWRTKLIRLFDTLVSLRLKKCDVLIGLNGNATVASKTAKRSYNAVTICDQGSSHILTQNAVHYLYNPEPVSEINTRNMLAHYAAADYLMSPSYYVRDSDVKHGIIPDRILLNPYGVDLERFKRENTSTTDERPYDVIMVGSWWKHKGCDLLYKVCVEKLKLKLLHVGGVIDCPVYSSPLFSHVDAVSEDKLPEFYSKAKIFVISSLDEGFALVLLQAAAMGLPIVGSSRTGLPIIKDKLLGCSQYLVVVDEPLNEANLERAVVEAMSLYKDNPVGASESYAQYIENISWNKYGERYYRILKELLKSSN